MGWVVLGGFPCVCGLLAFVSCFWLPLCGVKRPALRGARLVFALGVALLIAVRVLVFFLFFSWLAKGGGDDHDDEQPHDNEDEDDGTAAASWVGWCWGAFRAFAGF